MPIAPVSRARNAAATRSAILQSAWRRFTEQGYDGASLRDIAADAGFDVALVSRYFGSKEDLFREVLSSEGPPDDLISGDRATFGERLARVITIEPVQEGKLDKLLMILRSVSSPAAAELIRQNVRGSFYDHLESLLGGADRAVRARLIASMVTGAAIMRAIDDHQLLDETERKSLCRRFATVLQQIVDGAE